MRFTFGAVVVAALMRVVVPVSLTAAEEAKAEHDRDAVRAEVPTSPAGRTLTGKERLGEKWTDEQRVDNCNIPLSKRGTKPRPDCFTRPARQ